MTKRKKTLDPETSVRKEKDETVKRDNQDRRKDRKEEMKFMKKLKFRRREKGGCHPKEIGSSGKRKKVSTSFELK